MFYLKTCGVLDLVFLLFIWVYKTSNGIEFFRWLEKLSNYKMCTCFKCSSRDWEAGLVINLERIFIADKLCSLRFQLHTMNAIAFLKEANLLDNNYFVA